MTKADADADAECDKEGRLVVEPPSLNQIGNPQKSWALRVSGSGEQFELSQVQSRVDAVEKRSETCGSLSDASIDIDSVKAVFEAKAQSQNQVGSAQNSCEQRGFGSDKPIELSQLKCNLGPWPFYYRIL